MVQKVPPPPQLPLSFGAFGQQLNRWLLEIQSILNSGGTIDPSSVDGLPALFTQVATLATEVTTLSGQVATLSGQVTTLTGQVAANTAAITVLQSFGAVRNGSGAPSAGLGANGDLYINNTGSAGSNLYAKISGSWVAFA